VSFIFIDNKTSVEVDIPEQTQVIKGNRFASLKKNIVSENHRCKLFYFFSSSCITSNFMTLFNCQFLIELFLEIP
jgi:hypothetical protein